MLKKNWLAIVFLFVGVSMLALWSMLVLTDQVVEFYTAPFTTITHITAESLTGIFLIIAGIALFRHNPWAKQFTPLAVGMLFYAVVQASGYYIDHNSPFFVVLFFLLILVCLYFIRQQFLDKK